jgi:hypothetical protein
MKNLTDEEDDKDSLSSDTSMSGSNSDGFSSDWNDINDDADNNFIHFKGPALIYNAGPTMMGKTSFLKDVLLSHRLIPMPTKFILVVGAITEKERAEKTFSFMEVIKLAIPSMKKENVFSANTIEEGARIMEEEMEPSEIKMFFVDDAMATKAGVDSIALAAVGTHHQNLYLIFNVQHLFVKDSRSIRENTQYLIIWPGFSLEQLIRFLGTYPEEAKDRIVSLLSSKGQKDVDDDFDADEMEGKGFEQVRTPAIIDKSMENGLASIKIYNGLFDANPLVVSMMGKNDAHKSNLHNKFDIKADEIFGDSKGDLENKNDNDDDA